MEDGMDELNLEPLEPPEPKEKQVVASGMQRWNSWRFILPAGIVLGFLFALGVYQLVAPDAEKLVAPAPVKLVAQVFSFGIIPAPDTSIAVISISNKQERQTIIVQLYPVFFGKKSSPIYSRSIESTIEGISLPLVLNPGEVRVLKLHYSIGKKDLDEYADQLRDSSHMAVFQNGPPPGQLEGFLGLGWRVVDADGKNYTNVARLAYYVLIPSPKGFADPTSLYHSWILSDESFELCTQIDIVKKGG
jgi:hypothetical protein